MYQAVITTEDNSGLFQALKPEESQNPRSSVKIKKNKNKIEIVIKAGDAVSLRALLASISRLLTVHEKVN